MDALKTLPADLVTDAVQALDRYRFALENDLLIQAGSHEERDGRQLADVLGVLGSGVNSPVSCPAQVMPRWLAWMVIHFFYRMTYADATAWGLKFYEQLARLRGQVPFSVVYDWQATCVLDFWAASLAKRKFDPETMARKLAAVERVRALHRRHLAGGAASKAEWLEALRHVYANPAAAAYAEASGNAKVSTDANAYAYANANADVYASDDFSVTRAVPDAYVYSDSDVYAELTPSPDETPSQKTIRRRAENFKLLADGLVAALSRVPTPEAAA